MALALIWGIKGGQYDVKGDVITPNLIEYIIYRVRPIGGGSGGMGDAPPRFQVGGGGPP